MQTLTDSILLYIQQYSDWAWLIVFLIAFIESIAILGLFLPGWLLLVGIGTLIGTGVLSFYPTVIAAYLGAVIGEYISYFAGYYYHESILKLKLVARHQHLIEHSRLFFQKHGAAGVFFGRFFGPVRAFIPLIAGLSEMPKRTFFWVNIFSGLIWAPLYLIPGILIGAAFKVENEIALSILFIVFVYGLVIWFAVYQSKKMIEVLHGKSNANKHVSIINCFLAWIVALMVGVVFSKSAYFEVLLDILSVVLEKLG